MNKKVLIAGLIVVLPLLLILGNGFRYDPRELDKPLLGKVAPDFALKDIDGKVYRLSDLKGQPIVLNFWATWCGPCKYEHPVLVQAAREGWGNATYLGVVYQDDAETIRAFTAANGAWGPVLLDESGQVATAYGVYGVPETYFIDRQGTIQHKIAAPLDPQTLRGYLETIQ